MLSVEAGFRGTNSYSEGVLAVSGYEHFAGDRILSFLLWHYFNRRLYSGKTDF